MTDDLIITLDGGDWLGIALAAIAAFIVGFIWFTFLFGKRWGKEFGMDMDQKPSGRFMALSMTKDLVGNLLMAYVLFHVIVVWLPSLWAENFADMASLTVEEAPYWQYGLWGGLFTWLGFFVPHALSRTGWEGRSWTWFGIEVGYWFVKLAVMGQIIAAFL